ncbi:MAG: molybdenum cofactor guanylyltransferase [Candidatus Sulfotelmatobacter sp.]
MSVSLHVVPPLLQRRVVLKWRAVYYRGMGGIAAVDVTGFILAGGKSTRMGTDKAFVEFKGHTLLERALGLARSVTPDVRIVGAREKFAPFAPVVEDIFRERGPLGGIHAALRDSKTELNFMLAVDMPFVSKAFLQYLTREARTAAEAMVIVPLSAGRRQPLCAVYRPRFAHVAEQALAAGRNRIDSLFDTVETRVIGEDELHHAGFSSAIFSNLNTPEELDQQWRA